MKMNPINLTLRFMLEVSALISVGLWGWRYNNEWHHYVLVLLLPLLLAIVWGVFNVPDDPSRGGNAPVEVSGITRLGIEFAIFGIAALALYSLADIRLTLIFFAALVIHYIFSYQRIIWLLQG